MQLSTPEISFLSELVAEFSGNVIAERQAYILEKQLTPIAKRIGLGCVADLVSMLKRKPNPALATEIAEAVTINETSFFRDKHPFDALRKTIIPDLIKKNESKRSIRIWCAASSCGQEPYSIAMLIRETFPQLNDWKIEIIATDISNEMLDKCKSGKFSQLEVNRGLPARTLVRFFDRVGTDWQAKSELRKLISFRRLNLTKSFPVLGQFDIAFVRNVLIYFDQKTKKDILQRVRRVLHSDSYLFIGSVETTIGLGAPYRREEIDATVCYRPTNK